MISRHTIKNYFTQAAIAILLLAGLSGGTTELRASTPPLMFPTPKHLKVYTRQEDGVIHFYFQNLGLATITATCEMDMTNLSADVPFPYTTVLTNDQTVEAFTLAPVVTNAPWDFHFAHSCVIGSATAVPDETFAYRMPYAPGASYRVTQDYGDTFTHIGPDRYSIDWKMPIGTPVCAAREGIVVQTKDDSDSHGSSPKFEKCANYIMIQHSDGTIAIYGHLKLQSCKVNLGDHVNAGDVIALSGNTGYTHGPHLHFSVFKAKDGKERLSLPVKFRDATTQIVVLKTGHTYTAAAIEPLPAIVTMPADPSTNASAIAGFAAR